MIADAFIECDDIDYQEIENKINYKNMMKKYIRGNALCVSGDLYIIAPTKK